MSATTVTGIGPLTRRLTRARLRAREGEGLLYGAGVFAYTIASSLALTVAGGTWLFWTRWQHPAGLLEQAVLEATSFSRVLGFYFGLAAVACALLLPALANLATSAAVLGARGRERRLSVLRLLGLSSGDIARMTILDTLVQAGIGIALGTLAYLATLPLWNNLSMIAQPLRAEEMLVPWWLYLAVVAVLLMVAVTAAWRGLRQVSVSPLGVSRRSNKPRVPAWRLLGFVGALAAFIVLIGYLQSSEATVTTFLLMGAFMLVIMACINWAAPWGVQLVARALARVPGPTMRWASRRIAADPSTTWRRVSGMSLLSFIGGYMALMPLSLTSGNFGDGAVAQVAEAAQLDFIKGAIITLAVGFVLTASSLLVTQASATIERSEQSRALSQMGAPARYSLRVMWVETYLPLLGGIIGGAAVGILMSLPMYEQAQAWGYEATSTMTVVVTVLVTGMLLAALALAANHPLHYRLLRRQERRND